MTKLLEKLFDIGFAALIWDILDIDVVYESPQLSSVLRLEFHLMNAIGHVEFQGFKSSVLILKTDESISS